MDAAEMRGGAAHIDLGGGRLIVLQGITDPEILRDDLIELPAAFVPAPLSMIGRGLMLMRPQALSVDPVHHPEPHRQKGPRHDPACQNRRGDHHS
ncbi:MAG: hypothetical protein Q4G25_14755 [Paracoccus sp. (in: a-proteobacteria)]|nr:hypothetical protein [Paracoccus sp. (in: a-proteobacteria)]